MRSPPGETGATNEAPAHLDAGEERVTLRPLPPGLPEREAVERLRLLAYWLDDRFRLPGTNWRFGLDGLMGFVPGLGDLAAMLIASYLLLEARRLGMPTTKLARMAFNLGFDTALGSVPVLGNIFDFAYKANRKNLKLLLEHLQRP